MTRRPDAPRLCPYCLGTGKVHGVALVDYADGSSSVVTGMPCRTCCNGWVTARHLRAIQRGAEMRRQRLEAGRSLREEAARLNISATRLSAMERGDDMEMCGQ